MEKIASFLVNHNCLTTGIYTSRVDGDIVTYDIRMTLPNHGDYLDYDGIHTFEHLFATYARNTDHKEHVIYIGPMGCRTGFYLLVRDAMPPDVVIQLVRDACHFIASFVGTIPGSTPEECGNAAAHNLAAAQQMAEKMREVLALWTTKQLIYPQ